VAQKSPWHGSEGRWYWPLLTAMLLLVLVVEQLFDGDGGRWLFWAIFNLVLAQILTFLAGYQLRTVQSRATAGRKN
jgi:hypothetical protein